MYKHRIFAIFYKSKIVLKYRDYFLLKLLKLIDTAKAIRKAENTMLTPQAAGLCIKGCLNTEDHKFH